jgi:hypothetical protein
MTFLDRLARLGRRRPSDSADTPGAEAGGPSPDGAVSTSPDPTDEAHPTGPAETATADRSRSTAPASPAPVACPSCGTLLDPPPARNRRCPACRHPIVVRRIGGRTVYLTEAAVAVFESERRRHLDEAAWRSARQGWLRLARKAGAPEERVSRIAGRPISAEAVAQARALCETTTTRAIRLAARARRWGTAADLGRDLAAECHRADGSPSPPDAAALDLHRHAMRALLKSAREMGTHAELVGSACCSACRADDGRVFAIAGELASFRLPHEACPRGLCGCEWWQAGTPARTPKRRRRQG